MLISEGSVFFLASLAVVGRGRLGKGLVHRPLDLDLSIEFVLLQGVIVAVVEHLDRAVV